jgi:hypothetical protein
VKAQGVVETLYQFDSYMNTLSIYKNEVAKETVISSATVFRILCDALLLIG